MQHTIVKRFNWHDSGIEHRVRALLARMTLVEKAGQIFYRDCARDRGESLIREGTVGIVANVHGADELNRLQRIACEESRLRIPLLFANDVIQGYRTIFPIPLAQACSWDMAMIERNAAIAAREASVAGTRWTFTPMVDVARDPRWGRIAEGAGEDAFMNCAVGRAQLRGFQQHSVESGQRFIACAKHFAAYGAAEGGRDYDAADISESTLRNVYLPPFKACIDGGVETIMASFNELFGRPAGASRFLLTDILRREWGFEGLVITDYNAIYEFITHGIAASPAAAGREALDAGVDVDMNSEIFMRHLAELVSSGEVSGEVVDRAASRVLYLKFALGLFENPYSSPEQEAAVLLSDDHRRAARESARDSMVLLRNEGDLLPLRRGEHRIAVIGPLADDSDAPLGWWRCKGRPEETISVLAGIRDTAGAGSVSYAKGCELTGGTDAGFAEAVAAARSADVVVMVLGESARMSGEAHSRSDLGLPGIQMDLLRAVHSTGTPVAVVLINGRPLATPWIQENVPAILEAWQPGTEGGHAVADILFGDHVPSGKLVVSVPRAAGQVPIHYNRKSSGRPAVDSGAARYLDLPPRPFYPDPDTTRYLDLPPTPLHPFGFGLSYTRFEYRDLKLSAPMIAAGDPIEVTAVVRNTGRRAGVEVAQLYIQDVIGSITRPVKELRGFQRVALEPGEESTVCFTLGPEELGFYNLANEFVVEPGLFRVWVGPDSGRGLEAAFEVAG